jgi:transcriptional regulator with XRE-family HTH domain
MVDKIIVEMEDFGSFFRSKRTGLGYTLRSFCERYSYDPGNISRIERKLLPPSLDEDILSGYAKALQINKGTEDWVTFIDLAHIAKNRLPLFINEHSRHFLPLLFRTIRGKRISREKIEKIIELINVDE